MTIISKIRKELKGLSDPQVKKSGERFFKEEIKSYGVRTGDVVRVAKKYFKEAKDLPKMEIFDLCEELYQSGVIEESFIVSSWTEMMSKTLEPKDFKILEKFVKNYISNWASCDGFCNHAVGDFMMAYPEYVEQLFKWAKDKNRWARRASAVSLIVPGKKGMFLEESFKIADILLEDKDDMVQKGYGWLLKAQTEKHTKEVFDYVMKNKDRMPRTALRYAIEKMPSDLKKKAMEK